MMLNPTATAIRPVTSEQSRRVNGLKRMIVIMNVFTSKEARWKLTEKGSLPGGRRIGVRPAGKTKYSQTKKQTAVHNTNGKNIADEVIPP